MLLKFLQILELNILSFLFKRHECYFFFIIADATAIAKGKQPVIEAPQVPMTEAAQAPPPRSIMRESRARMEEISHNVDNIANVEKERFKADRCQWPLGRPDYALGDGGDY
ncbi:hypothetical protein AAC387_Pa11g0632 [Persea americana]